MQPLVVAVDQGSSATKALVLDRAGRVVGRSRVPVVESRPRPGWVEQDAAELRASVRRAVRDGLAGLDPAAVVAVGLANQRESLVLWDRATGIPAGPLLSWQDQRTAGLCRDLSTGPLPADAARISGLPLDPMFSAPKARWLLDTYDPDRRRATRGDLCLGTVDGWLLSTPTRHVVELGNASRTQLLDLTTATWSPTLLDAFGIPAATLPEIVPSTGPFPPMALDPLPGNVPVLAVLGDSHAALFGHGIRTPGTLKATYGTGSSVMGLAPSGVDEGLARGVCRTIAWQLGSGPPRHALEGNIRSAGATLAWLARLLGTTSDGLAELAATATSDGVHLVPGFAGLAAPWWDRDATGLIAGLSLATGPAELARAALESIAFQVADVVTAIAGEGRSVARLLADGGASVNDTLMRFQADLSGLPVHRSRNPDVSALGAAHLAGLAAGVWDEDQLAAWRERPDVFEPDPSADRAGRLAGWHAAVRRARTPDPTADSTADSRGEHHD